MAEVRDTLEAEELTLTWNLDDIVPEDKFEDLFAQAEEDVALYQGFFDGLNPEMTEETFQALMAFEEQQTDHLSRLFMRPGLEFQVDQASAEAHAKKSRVRDLNDKHADACRKIWHWIKGLEVEEKDRLDDNNATRLFGSVPKLTYFLTRKREAAKHTLREDVERMASKKNKNLRTPIIEFHAKLETKFQYTFAPEGQKPVTYDNQGDLNAHRHSQDPAEREAAYRGIFGAFEPWKQEFFMLYQARAKDWMDTAAERGHPSSISMWNFASNVPDEAVEALLDVCTENRTIYHDYFRFLAKELGVNKLERFHIYAPLQEAGEKKISFPDSKRMVLGALREFDPRFADAAERIFEADHVDSHPRKSKIPGAFCQPCIPGVVPCMMLNHTGRSRDVATKAHELGHCVHGLYSQHQSILAYDAPLPICETASTFAEMIIFEKMLAQEKDPAVRKAMLAEKMANSYATVCRQNYFVKFELAAHEALKNGAGEEQLSDICMANLEEQFGDSVALDPMFRHEWMTIPHIFKTPFYCYSYSFGDLLAMSLYSRYKEEGSSFLPAFNRILEAGGSRDPVELLKTEAQVDITTREFWQGGFGLIQDWMDQLKGYE